MLCVLSNMEQLVWLDRIARYCTDRYWQAVYFKNVEGTAEWTRLHYEAIRRRDAIRWRMNHAAAS